jgi:tetratricopeptide (TPR) repeat protein
MMRSLSGRTAQVTVVAAILSLAAPVSAQEEVEAARTLARRGTSLYDLGKYTEALQAFESAYEKKQVPALLFNIAQCHRQLGHLEQAARVYKSYLRTDPPEAAAKQASELLAKVEEALKQQNSAVQAPPHDLSEAAAKKPPAPVAAVAVAPAPSPPPRERKRWPALAAGGVAVTALALGIVWGTGSKSATNELAQLHQAGPVDPARDAALRSDASSRYNRSKVSYAVAAAAAAAGVALYFTF